MSSVLGDLAGTRAGQAMPVPRPSTPTAPGEGLRLSVIVASCGRPLLLLRCLQALYAQSLPGDAFEILVVDDWHDDATRRLVNTLAEEQESPRLRYLRAEQPRSGPAAARNLGWRSAHGDIVAFTEDHTVPLDDWLAQGEAAMRAGPWAALAGRVMVPLGPEPPTDHARTTQALERSEFVTANAFVRRQALQQLKGFDKRFEGAWREDADLHFRLQDIGEAVGRCDSAVVVHPVRGERWGASLRRQRNGFFEALLYAKHPRRYRAQGGQPTPWNFYLIVLLALGVPVLGWLDITGSAVVSGLLCVALILRFAAQRLSGSSHRGDHVLEVLVTSALIPFLSVFWRLRGAWHFRVLFF